MSEQGSLSIKNRDILESLHAEDNSEKLQSIKRLELRFEEYARNFPGFLKKAEDLHDLSEKSFIENELSVFEGCYKLYNAISSSGKLENESTTAFYDNLTYVDLIFIAYSTNRSTILNSTKRKIEFLQQRLKSFTVADLEVIKVLYPDKYDNSDDEIVHLDITATRHRLIFLYELGIIEMIERDYPIGTYGINAITTIVQSILNLPIRNTESIRSELGRLRNSKPKVKKKVLTDAAIKKLKIELSKIGIEPTKRI